MPISTTSFSANTVIQSAQVNSNFNNITGAIPWSSNPIAAKGDLLVGSAASTTTTLSIGATGKVLTVVGGTAAWSDAQNANLVIKTKSAGYTLLNTDDIVLASGSINLTLPDSASNNGKLYRIEKTDASLSNIITILPTGSDTIQGGASTTLNTQYESIELLSNGGNWVILNRKYPSEWVAYTPTFTGLGTVSTQKFFSRRVGDTLQIKGVAAAGTTTATEMRISLGYGGTDGNVTSAGTSKIADPGTYLPNVCGVFAFNFAGAYSGYVLSEPSVGYVTFGMSSAGTAGADKVQGAAILNAGQSFTITAEIPIAGWNS